MQKIKFDVKPGITGLAQIDGRGRLSFQETLKKDVEYVQNKSILYDAKIILRTIKEVANGDGAF